MITSIHSIFLGLGAALGVLMVSVSIVHSTENSDNDLRGIVQSSVYDSLTILASGLILGCITNQLRGIAYSLREITPLVVDSGLTWWGSLLGGWIAALILIKRKKKKFAELDSSFPLLAGVASAGFIGSAIDPLTTSINQSTMPSNTAMIENYVIPLLVPVGLLVFNTIQRKYQIHGFLLPIGSLFICLIQWVKMVWVKSDPLPFINLQNQINSSIMIFVFILITILLFLPMIQSSTRKP
jgi:hypothetical protein